MRILAIFAVLAGLAGCGADGAPTRPEEKRSGPFSLQISGTAEIGIVGGSRR